MQIHVPSGHLRYVQAVPERKPARHSASVLTFKTIVLLPTLRKHAPFPPEPPDVVSVVDAYQEGGEHNVR